MPSKVERPAALAEAFRTRLGKLKRKLREQASVGDLTQSQTSVLVRLEKDGPATVSGLARAEGMRPQSMGELVAGLERSGYVRGAADRNDGRQTLWSLTERCRETIRKGRAARQDWLARRIATLTSKEQEVLGASIELIDRITSEGEK